MVPGDFVGRHTRELLRGKGRREVCGVEDCRRVAEGVEREAAYLSARVMRGPPVEELDGEAGGGGEALDRVFWENVLGEHDAGGVADGEFVPGAGVGRAGGLGVEGRGAEAGDASEDGVHHRAGAGADAFLGPLHGVVDGGVGGDLVEEEELRGSGEDDRAHPGLELVHGLVEEGLEDVLEGGPAGDDGVVDGVREGEVARVQGACAGGVVGEFIYQERGISLGLAGELAVDEVAGGVPEGDRGGRCGGAVALAVFFDAAWGVGGAGFGGWLAVGGAGPVGSLVGGRGHSGV